MPRLLLPYFLLAALAFLSAGSAFAADNPPKIPPTAADVAYGPDPRQKLDVYVPTTGKGPFPILFWIHGGGWFAGDKRNGCTNIPPYLDHGCAVVSVDYRLIADARAQKICPPVAAVFADNRRALQFVRLHAADWNLDPAHIVAAGGSAGSVSALYLGCEGEQANPQSPDPVQRVSTKVSGVCAENAQGSLDPQRIHEWLPGCAYAYWAFESDGPTLFTDGGLPSFNKFLAEREKWLPEIKKYSPDWLLTKNAPPIYFSFGLPLPTPDTKPWPHSDALVHCPLWGVGFQKLARQIGATCYLQYPGHPAEKYRGEADFILQTLGIIPK
jgi:acetyl esterase/lipase